MCVCTHQGNTAQVDTAQVDTLIFCFFDGYCSTVQGLLDWFEVDLGFTELSFIQIVCSACFCSLLPRFTLLLSFSGHPALPPARGGSASRVSPQSCQSHESLCVCVCALHGVSGIHAYCSRLRGGGLGSRPKKMYGERLRNGVEYHLMKPTPRR